MSIVFFSILVFIVAIVFFVAGYGVAQRDEPKTYRTTEYEYVGPSYTGCYVEANKTPLPPHHIKVQHRKKV